MMTQKQADWLAQAFLVEAKALGEMVVRIATHYKCIDSDEFRNAVSPALFSQIEEMKASIEKQLDGV